MNKKSFALTTGFALFSMFFGSGNLVFPIAVGQVHANASLYAALGIILTGVLVPFLGVYGMSLFHGSTTRFFSSLGKHGPFWFSLLALSLMGPFGVMARCLTVAHGSIQLLLPEAGLVPTSLGLCAVIYACTSHKTRIVQLLGSYLTPVLLLSILGLTYMGLIHAPAQLSTDFSWSALKEGFLKGYQTMDLLAAFFFSKFIIQHLDTLFPGEKHRLQKQRTLFMASCLGAGLLAVVYLFMVLLGSIFSESLAAVPAEEMIGKIALMTLGQYAGPLLCVLVVLACLTTAIVLTSLFAHFVNEKIFHYKLGESNSLILTLLIGFLVSTLDFAGIAAFIGPILEFSYPALIVLTLVNIAHKKWQTPLSHWPATITLLTRFFYY
jgi:LIVCS family branched-chain amino acid:cation transporter